MMKEFIQKTGNAVVVLTDMFNLIKDCIFLMEAENDSFRYVYINDSAQKLLNTQKKIIGSRIEDLLSKERSEKLRKSVSL